MDLVPHAVRVDHHAGVVADHHAGHRHLAGALVHRHGGDPGRPGGAEARKLAVDIARIGKAAPAQYLALGGVLHGLATGRPAGALGGGLDQVHGARV
ncbi:hypothetical protein D3C72_2073740 [compost metagenome]